MFSGSQVLSAFPLWDPYLIGFCPHSVLSDYSVACCCSRHFSPKGWKYRSKKLSLSKTVLFEKEIFAKSPSLISSYISLEGIGSHRSLGSQAKGNGASSAWVGHIVSPNKMKALLGRKK